MRIKSFLQRYATLAWTLCAGAAILLLLATKSTWSLFGPDTRYMVAVGRWIIENGRVPTTDMLTLHTGLNYVCQQWLTCVAVAEIYGLFGEIGIKVMFCAIDLSAIGAVWWATLPDKEDARLLHGIVIAAFASICAWMCGSTPRALDVAVLAIGFKVARTWLGGSDDRLLAFYPASALAMANLHGALWTVALMVPCCALADPRVNPAKKLKMFTVSVASFACCLINPYGIKSLLVPFLTMGAHSLDAINISELKPIFTSNPVMGTVILGFAVGNVFLRFRKRKSALPSLGFTGDILIIGTAALMLSNSRNSLLCCLAIALSISEIADSIEAPATKRNLALACAPFALLGAVLVASVLALPIPTEGETACRDIIEALDDNGIEPGDRVICDIDMGSELDLLGYKPLVDTRAELFCPEVNGGADAWGRILDIMSGDKGAVMYAGADYAVISPGIYPDLEGTLLDLGFHEIARNDYHLAFAR